ncbi:MAG: hypothetical protein KKB37_13980, partial [Alphaproteobacteria bacterium]|nr:hypothetical protein [Alphaproteobacteria bacterium]
MISSINLTRLAVPLKVPYKLALGDVKVFDTILAEVMIADRSGLGEASIVTGYTTETIDASWAAARRFAEELLGRTGASARAHLAPAGEKMPFMVAMFTTAIEMAERHDVLASGHPAAVPILFGLNPTGFDEIDRELDRAATAGFGTVKVKVGFDLEADLE